MDDPPVKTLHALRIDCKRLRYALELLEDVLGTSGRSAIELVKGAQDHLGEMHDAHVATLLIAEFRKAWAKRVKGKGTSKDAIAGVLHYAAACKDEERRRVETFHDIWLQLHNPAFRRLLADASIQP
jgi:CHAD domain-containing protein